MNMLGYHESSCFDLN